MIPVPADPERNIRNAAENKRSDMKNHQKAEDCTQLGSRIKL